MKRLISLLALVMIAVACAPERVSLPYDPVPEPPAVIQATTALVGDSFTEGSGVGGQNESGWPHLVKVKLQKQNVIMHGTVLAEGGAGYVKVGNYGHVFGDAVPRIGPDTDLVVIFGSVNDSDENYDEVRTAAGSLFAAVRDRAPRASILVIGPAPLPVEATPGVAQARDAIKQAADANGIEFVDPLAEQWLVDASLMGADGVHPNDQGHMVLADRIWPHIEKAIRALPPTTPSS